LTAIEHMEQRETQKTKKLRNLRQKRGTCPNWRDINRDEGGHKRLGKPPVKKAAARVKEKKSRRTKADGHQTVGEGRGDTAPTHATTLLKRHKGPTA